jgi:hypothetical protein
MVRVGSAIFLTLNLMVFTMALWSPDVYGPGMADNRMERAYEDLFRHLSLLAAAPVMLLLGPPLARSAWHRPPHRDWCLGCVSGQHGFCAFRQWADLF